MNRDTETSKGFEMVFSENELTVTVSGEIDHHRAVGLRTEVDGEIARLCPRRLILDLSRTDMMDSSGLGFIMGRSARVGRIGGELVLRDPTERVMKILHLAGLDKTFKIEKTEKTERKDGVR